MSTSKRFTPSPSGLELALAFEVSETECNLPRPPGTVNGWEAFPIINLAWEIFGREDSCRGHHHKFDISDGHARPFCLFLHILHHDDELGDAIHLHVILYHISAEGNHVDGMQPPAVGVEEGHDVDGHCVEHFGILEIGVPDLADNIAKNFGDASFDRLVDGVWSSQRGGIYGPPLYEHG